MRTKFFATLAFSFLLTLAFSSYANSQVVVGYGYSIIVWDDEAPQRVSGIAGTYISYHPYYDAAVFSCLWRPVTEQCMSQGNLHAYPWIEGYHPTFYAISNQTYCVDSRHGLWFLTYNYLVSTGVCHTFPVPLPTPTPTATPPCEPITGGLPPCITPTPTPSPTPLPTPSTLTVTEVGFTGDYGVTRFATNQPIDSPDGSTPTWVRGSGNNDKNPVAYKKGATNVSVFAKFTVVPESPISIDAVIKVSKGSTALSQNVPVTISGGTLVVPNISLNSSLLEPAVEVKRKKYKLKWEISFNNGQTWGEMGNSGDHEIHWLFDAPLQPAWENFNGQQFSGLFDEALNHSTGELGGGQTDMKEIIKKISKEVATDVAYKPGRDPEPLNPLSIVAQGGSRRALCPDNALLLRGLLRSIGIEGSISYHWGGNPTTGARHFYYRPGTDMNDVRKRLTLQVSRPVLGEPCTSENDPRECVEKNPHFSYHATVAALGNSFDPSYGEVENEVKFIESISGSGQIKSGNAANTFKVTRGSFASTAPFYDSRRACSHGYDFYGTGRSPVFNFDSDGITDVAIVRGSTGEWWITNSFDDSITTLYHTFQPGDLIAPGDYDGDGKIDAAVWRPSDGRWLIRRSSDNNVAEIQWGNGSLGDVPVPGDYDNDGKSDVAVWRASTGEWWVLRSSDWSYMTINWGTNGDVPVQGDYDGDGKTDTAIWRSSNGTWWVLKSSDWSYTVTQWGLSSDITVTGDYDGDGITDFAVLRPSTGVWYSLDSSNDYAWRVQQGEILNSGDFPIPGDYDGDSQTDAAIWRISDGTWRIISSRDNSFQVRWWGNSSLGDIPVPSADVFR